jgi:cephalosporin hydroxylase
VTQFSEDRITIDMRSGQVRVMSPTGETICAIGSPEAFAIISRAWLRSGWDNKYVYGFTWLGRPIIQLPEDMIRIQEVIYRLQPDVIIETGVAHGGSLLFYASLCQLMGKGRVIGIEIDLRPSNRTAIESHSLFRFVSLIEGNSIDPATISRVRYEIAPGANVIVLLDSCHTRQHVLAELTAYAPLVSRGSYIVAMDGIMEEVAGAPRTQSDWTWNNPRQAALEFVRQNPDFRIEEPPSLFNEGNITQRVTYWPSAFIKCVRGD